MLQGRNNVGGIAQMRRASYTSLLVEIKFKKLSSFLFWFKYIKH